MKTTPIDERISALVDNELSGFEVRRVAQELMQNDTRRERWGRYHAIGEIMRENEDVSMDRSFADGVMAQIEAETTQQAGVSASPVRSKWVKPVMGLAIAASVAVVSLFTLKTLTSDDPAVAPTPMASNTQTAPKPAAMATPVSVTETTTLGIPAGTSKPQARPAGTVIVDPSFDSYLSTHAEFAAQPSLKPQTRVVGYGQETEK